MNDHALAYLGKERGPIRTPVIFKQGTITASQGARITPFSTATAPSPSLPMRKRVGPSGLEIYPIKKGSRLDGEVSGRLSKKKKSLTISVFYHGNYQFTPLPTLRMSDLLSAQ